ncbi:MAG: tetratricopeptide repeat protein [Treponema sp.]|jgi:Tfp pilus assembly protein PilF|nr:tetratricopeptide repeat protein [Treponema sp.]MBQ5877865.1 tetratricopeptide repeat protein [Treponema sp.]
MNPTNPLESVYFISLPENFDLNSATFQIDKTIPLPVQKKDTEETLKLEDITQEQILAGILTILAYDKHNKNLDYYRSIIKQVRPDIKKEMTEAAIMKAKNEDWDIAEELFMVLKGLDPEDSITTLNTALFFDQRAESYRQAELNEDADAYDNDALLHYKEAMNAEPAIPDAFFNAGFFYLKQHSFREAKDCFETYLALTCDSNDEELGENGIYKKERAQEILNHINNDNMDDEAFKRAYKLISSGQEEKGLEEIRTFIQKNPNVWNAWFLLGWGLRRIGRWADAEQAFNQSLSCGGENNCDTYNELAICLMEQGKTKEAKKSLQKALSINPENVKIISNLGYLSLKEGNIDDARKYFTIVLEYSPNDKIALSELAKLETEE